MSEVFEAEHGNHCRSRGTKKSQEEAEGRASKRPRLDQVCLGWAVLCGGVEV